MTQSTTGCGAELCFSPEAAFTPRHSKTFNICTTANLSIFVHAVFQCFLQVTCFPRPHSGSPAVQHFCKFATRWDSPRSECDWLARSWQKFHSEMFVMKRESCSLLTFYWDPARPPALCPSPHSSFHMMPRSAVSSKPPICRELTSSPSLPLCCSSLTKQHVWDDAVLLPLCVCARVRVRVRVVPARRAAPSPLFVTLDWTASSQPLHCWHSPADVTRSPHSQHGERGAARRCYRREARARALRRLCAEELRESHYWLRSSPRAPPPPPAGTWRGKMTRSISTSFQLKHVWFQSSLTHFVVNSVQTSAS